MAILLSLKTRYKLSVRRFRYVFLLKISLQHQSIVKLLSGSLLYNLETVANFKEYVLRLCRIIIRWMSHACLNRSHMLLYYVNITSRIFNPLSLVANFKEYVLRLCRIIIRWMSHACLNRSHMLLYYVNITSRIFNPLSLVAEVLTSVL